MKLEHLEEICNEATPAPWYRCFHLYSAENDKKCPCGYRGNIWGEENFVICEMGSTVVKGEEGLEHPRYEREHELANARFIEFAREYMPKLLKIAQAALDAYALGLISCEPDFDCPACRLSDMFRETGDII